MSPPRPASPARNDAGRRRTSRKDAKTQRRGRKEKRKRKTREVSLLALPSASLLCVLASLREVLLLIDLPNYLRTRMPSHALHPEPLAPLVRVSGHDRRRRH